MKLGLIGYPLSHSWSKEIHERLIACTYDLIPLQEQELDAFFAKKDFDGLNVTIPYKQTVMKYLDELDKSAESVGAVNCIVNRNGKLIGYNTDCDGFSEMLKMNHVDLTHKTAAILGSGGASKAVQYALQRLGVPYNIVSRSTSDQTITYQELYDAQNEYHMLINATPVGMDPNCDDMPVDLSRFTALQEVVDIIANPLRTRLMFEAKKRGIHTFGGFEMLVYQALVADRYFLQEDVAEEKAKACIASLLYERRNIVLIGMPTSGKSTISKMLAEKLGKPCIEMDAEIEEELGTTIAECFAEKGESYFRNLEKEVAKKHRKGNGEIISCGGGVVTNDDTMRYLSENGLLIWIQRDLVSLYASDDRPLSKDLSAVQTLYEKRMPLYETYSDKTVDNNQLIENTIAKILEYVKG